MKPKLSHGGSAITYHEYEVREIDNHGDVIDVGHYETKRQALGVARALAHNLKEGESMTKAVVVELHTSRHPGHLFNKPDEFKTVATFGARKALEAGGWA